MTNIFSQVITKDNLDYTYNCSIDDNDLVIFSHTILHDKTNLEIMSNISINFLSLREFFHNDMIDYESNDFIILDSPEHFRIYSKIENDKILLPKSFLIDVYKILANLWEEPEFGYIS